MKPISKAVALILALTLTLSLAACGEAEPAAPSITDFPHYSRLADTAEEVAADFGVTIEAFDAEISPEGGDAGIFRTGSTLEFGGMSFEDMLIIDLSARKVYSTGYIRHTEQPVTASIAAAQAVYDAYCTAYGEPYVTDEYGCSLRDFLDSGGTFERDYGGEYTAIWVDPTDSNVYIHARIGIWNAVEDVPERCSFMLEHRLRTKTEITHGENIADPYAPYEN